MTDKEKIRAEIERVKEIHERNLDKPTERGRIGHARGYVDCCDEILDIIDSLPEESSCGYATQKITPIPSVNIEDVARVQFASHARVLDRRRKAVFDWEQFKKVASIFYGFCKKNSLPEENGRTLFEEIAYPGLNPTPKIPEMKKEEEIDAEVVKDIHNLLHIKSDPLPMPSEHKFGDKVKIIIIREQ